MQLFCPNCGIKNTKQNYEKKRLEVGGRLCDVYMIPCDTCGMVSDIVVQIPATKNEEEIEEAFQNTPLTDSQQFGGGKRKKKGIVPNSKSD